ncbi:hypothetical protein DFA_09326 [Cavenderia fasciculata]|uniref:Uncharacterized protein n=1 Tax=Cavenderia fasciculata TaxID=261658 RepID=F4Q7B4_CACFS|nr:uncharacterized protein DFA_09326 [Cavenderia fasciculata]EGG16296.1 hypothetical protein DFA_09326 [Cavenderia fasciculata]|eukprot:XP_004354680.1 hypothetical protein DFA_09326 [Cavenderia fasciculata]
MAYNASRLARDKALEENEKKIQINLQDKAKVKQQEQINSLVEINLVNKFVSTS